MGRGRGLTIVLRLYLATRFLCFGVGFFFFFNLCALGYDFRALNLSFPVCKREMIIIHVEWRDK